MINNLHIMIVDDEPIVGKRLKRLLEKDGCDVDTFTDGVSAIEALETKHFDIIVTDLMMEGVKGVHILETAKKRNPATKVIIITGFSNKETAEEVFRKGAFDLIIKPFKVDELKVIIKKARTALSK